MSFSFTRVLAIFLLAVVLLGSSLAAAESVDVLWLDSGSTPALLYSDGVYLCLSQAEGNVHMQVELGGSLLLDADCGFCSGSFRSQAYYFPSAGQYTFTLRDGCGSFRATVQVERAPAPTAFDWLGL